MLVAIVINSANSYDKMEQLNQSAKEVFFVMENQETEELPETEEARNDIVIERETSEQNVLQDSVLQENAVQGQRNEEDKTTESRPGTDAVDAAVESPEETAGQENVPASSLGDARTQEEDGEILEEDREDDSAGAQEEKDMDALPEAEKEEGNEGQETADEEDGVEALSRNVARYYEVERGDTLYMISKKVYGDTSHVKQICEINQITDPDSICYGQKIILP